MKQAISFNSYLTKILIIAALFFTLPMVISSGGDLPTAASYIRSIVCFFVLTWVGVSLLLGKKYVKFYLIAFGVQIVVGLIHYLIFVDPAYFSSDGNPSGRFWREYLSVYDALDAMISDRHSEGLLYFNPDSFYASHPEIWQVISWPITFLGHKWMNYAPLNSFASLMASANILLVFNTQYKGTENEKKSIGHLVLLATVYFPLFLLNDKIWRDPFGVFLISIGLTLITFSDSIISKSISFVALAVFSFVQRTVYLLITGAVTALREISIKKTAIKVLLIPVFVALFILFFQIFSANEQAEYTSGYVNDMSFLALPIKIIFGLIGPFPWWVFPSIAAADPAFSFSLSKYIMGVFQVGYLLAIIFNFKNISFRNLDYMTLMGFGIMLAGFMTKQLHIEYIAEGLIFTLPWFFSQIGSKYKMFFWISFVLLILLNILTIVLGSSGITNFYR